MIDFNQGATFKEYLISSKEEYQDEQIDIYNKITLSDKIKEVIDKVDQKVILLAFAEIYCPDCRILMPFLKKIEKLNDNIKLTIFPREEYEGIMIEYTGVARIPTVIAIDSNEEVIGQYIEFPKKLKEDMKFMQEEEKTSLIKEYRVGKYNQLIEEDLLKIFKLS